VGREGRRRGGEKGENGKGWRRKGEKVTEGMGGTGQDMGWGRGKGKEEGDGREERGYSPQTSIPGAATAFIVTKITKVP